MIEYEVEVFRTSGRQKGTWREVQKDCQARNLNMGMLWIVVDGGS